MCKKLRERRVLKKFAAEAGYKRLSAKVAIN